MKPEDVPDQLATTLGERLYDDYHENCDEIGCSGISHQQCEQVARDYLGLVLPAHEAMVRQRVAAELIARAETHPLGSAFRRHLRAAAQMAVPITPQQAAKALNEIYEAETRGDA